MTVRDMRPVRPVDTRTPQGTSGFVVKVRGIIATAVNGDFYADTGNKVNIKFDIIDKDTPRTDLDQIILKTPLVRMFDGKPVGEMFLDVSIVKGVFTISGKFTTSGRWVLNFDAVNESLKSIGSDWKLAGDDITFLV